MTLSRIKWDAVAIAMLILLVIALCVTVKIQSSSKALLALQNEQLKQEKTSAEARSEVPRVGKESRYLCTPDQLKKLKPERKSVA